MPHGHKAPGRDYYNIGVKPDVVQIYSKMGLWENSVDLALEKGDLELAKANANMPEDDRQLRKKLWLKIAKYVVQDKKDIKRYLFTLAVAVALLLSCASVQWRSWKALTFSRSRISCHSSLISLLLTISRRKYARPWRVTPPILML